MCNLSSHSKREVEWPRKSSFWLYQSIKFMGEETFTCFKHCFADGILYCEDTGENLFFTHKDIFITMIKLYFHFKL
jgi:hypothetical protein